MSKSKRLSFCFLTIIIFSVASLAMARESQRAGSLPAASRCVPSDSNDYKVTSSNDVTLAGSCVSHPEKNDTWLLVSTNSSIHSSKFSSQPNKLVNVGDLSINAESDLMRYQIPVTQNIRSAAGMNVIPNIDISATPQAGALWLVQPIDARLGLSVSFKYEASDYECTGIEDVVMKTNSRNFNDRSNLPSEFILAQRAYDVLQKDYCGQDFNCISKSLIACGGYNYSPNGYLVCNIFYTFSYKSNMATYTDDIYNCGPSGMAVVVKPKGDNLIGESGSGLGYKGLAKILAVEFDNKKDEKMSDPATAQQRHISVKLYQGLADAVESDFNLLAWNNAPRNWNPEGFTAARGPSDNGGIWTVTFYKGMVEVVFKKDDIEIIDLQWLPPSKDTAANLDIANHLAGCKDLSSKRAILKKSRQSIELCYNQAFQKLLKYKFDLPDILKTQDTKFQVGFTASTGPSGTGNIAISQISVKEFLPNCKSSSKLTIVNPETQLETEALADVHFNVVIDIRDTCSNSIFTSLAKTNSDIDKIQVELTTPFPYCQVGNIYLNTYEKISGQFILPMICQSSGDIVLSIKWYQCPNPWNTGIKINDPRTAQQLTFDRRALQASTPPSTIPRATVKFSKMNPRNSAQGYGDVDNEVKFDIIGDAALGNLFPPNINIQWPNDKYDEQKIQIKTEKKGTQVIYHYRIVGTDVGLYTISSSLLDKNYEFYMDTGAPYFEFSEITPSNTKSFAEPWSGSYTVTAGLSIDIIIRLRDRAGNFVNPNTKTIDMNQITVVIKQVTEGDISSATNEEILSLKAEYIQKDGSIFIPYKITKAGLQVFIGYVNTRFFVSGPQSLSSKITANPGPSSINKSSFWLANDKGIYYNSDLTDFGSYPVDRQGAVNWWVRLRDEYGNYCTGNEYDKYTYTVSLSGYGLENDGEKFLCQENQAWGKPGPVFKLCPDDCGRSNVLWTSLYRRLVFRTGYTAAFTMINKAGKTMSKPFRISINRRYNDIEYDLDADNAPLDMTQSQMGSSGDMVAGIWNQNYLIFRTETGKRYNMDLRPYNPFTGVTSSIPDSSLLFDLYYYNNWNVNYYTFQIYSTKSTDHIKNGQTRTISTTINLSNLPCWYRIKGNKVSTFSMTKRVFPNQKLSGYVLETFVIDEDNVVSTKCNYEFIATMYETDKSTFRPCLLDNFADQNTNYQLKIFDAFGNPTKWGWTYAYQGQPSYFLYFDGATWRPIYPDSTHYVSMFCGEDCRDDLYADTYNLFKLNYPLRMAYKLVYEGYVYQNCYLASSCPKHYGRNPIAYNLYNHPGRPNAWTSWCYIDNNDKSYITAGKTLGLTILLRDSWWNILYAQEYSKPSNYPQRYKDVKIEGYLDQPIGSSPTASTVQTARAGLTMIPNFDTESTFYLKIRNQLVTQAGTNRLVVTIDGVAISCPNWVQVFPASAVWDLTDVFYMSSGRWIYMGPNDKPVLQNYNAYPSFYTRQKDIYHNYLGAQESGWTNLNAYFYDMQKRMLQYYPAPPQINGVSGSLVLQFISRIWDQGQNYYLDYPYYQTGTQNQTNLFTYPYGSYQIVFTGVKNGVYNQILRNLMLYGEGPSDSIYDGNVDANLDLSKTVFSNNGFNTTSGEWAVIHLSFKTVNNLFAKFRYIGDIHETGIRLTQASKTNPDDADKKEDTVILRNWYALNHPTNEGTVIINVMQQRKGNYTYNVEVNTNYRDQANGKWVKIPTQLKLRFNHRPTQYIVWDDLSLIKPDQLQLIHQRVDDSNIFNFTAYDMYHNKIEEISDDVSELKFNIALQSGVAQPTPRWTITRTSFESRQIKIIVEQAGIYVVSSVGVKRNQPGLDMTKVILEKQTLVREWATYVDADKSQARVNITDLNAGENLGYTVQLYDRFGNPFELIARPFVGDSVFGMYSNSNLCLKYNYSRHSNMSAGQWNCLDGRLPTMTASSFQEGLIGLGKVAKMYWAGKMEVALYFNKTVLIPARLGSNNALVNVNPLTPNFETTNLWIRDTDYLNRLKSSGIKTGVVDQFLAYNPTLSWVYDAQYLPLVKLSIQDKYGNDVNNLPAEFFKYTYDVQVTNERAGEGQIFSDVLRLSLCKVVTESMGAFDRKILFQVCPAPAEIDDESLDPSWQWGNFAPGDVYSISLKMTKPNEDVPTLEKLYKLNLKLSLDESGSITTLPENLAMTKIYQSSIITQAGQQATVDFDLTASNGKRRYYWYPRSKTQNENTLFYWNFVDTSKDEFVGNVFNTTRGPRRGMYVTYMNTTKAFGIGAASKKVRLVARDYEVMGKDVTWINYAACTNENGYDITQLRNIHFRDSKYPQEKVYNTKNYYTMMENEEVPETPTLPSGKVGFTYNLVFSVHDLYDNQCKIDSEGAEFELAIIQITYVNSVTIIGEDGSEQKGDVTSDVEFAVNTIFEDNYFKVSFDPPVSTNYTININGRSAVAWVAPGSASPGQSTAHIDDTSAGLPGIRAGNPLIVVVDLHNGNGNKIVATDSDLSRSKVYYKREGEIFWKLFLQKTPALINDGYSLQFSEIVEQQGTYEVRVTMDDAKIFCSLCSITFIPDGSNDFLKAKLLYLSYMSGQWTLFDETNLQTLLVGSELPSYYYKLADQFGNVYKDLSLCMECDGVFTASFLDDEAESKVVISPTIGGKIDFDWNLMNDGGVFTIGSNMTNWKNPQYVVSGMAKLKISYTRDSNTQPIDRVTGARFISTKNNDTDTDVVDLNKTQIITESEDGTPLYTQKLDVPDAVAGEPTTIIIEFKTVNNLRKSDMVENITAEFSPINISTAINQPEMISVTPADANGRFAIQVVSNQSYVDEPLKVMLLNNGTSIGLDISIYVFPAELTNATVFDDYTSYVLAGEEATFTVGGYDDYGNRASFANGDPGVIVSPPVDKPMANSNKNSTEVDESVALLCEISTLSKKYGLTYALDANNNFAYKYSSDKAGVHTIKGSLISYKYILVDSLLPDPQSTNFIMLANTTLAGEEAEFIIQAMDKFKNTIPINYLEPNKTIFSINFVLGNGETIVVDGSTLKRASDSISTNALYGKVKITLAGAVKIYPTIKDSEGSFVDMICNNCNLVVYPNDLEIKNTVVKKDKSAALEIIQENPEATRRVLLQEDQETKKRVLQAQINDPIAINDDEYLELYVLTHDAYGNSLIQLASDALFTAEIYGHGILKEVDAIPLDVNINYTTATMSIVGSSDRFMKLVPFENYTIFITYYVEKIDPNFIRGNVSIQLAIQGINIGYSNGNLSIPATTIEPQLLRFIANSNTSLDANDMSQSFMIQLRTQKPDSFLYFGDFDTSRVTLEYDNDKLNVTMKASDTIKNIFYVTVQSIVANYDKDLFQIGILIDGEQVGKNVTVDVDPAIPDISKTQVTPKWDTPYVVIDNISNIHIKLYDKYDNVIKPNENVIKSISVNFLTNNGNMSDVSYTSGDIIIVSVRANFPVPSVMRLDILWKWYEGFSVSVLNHTLTYDILTKLDSAKTKFYGQYLYGTNVETIFQHYILPVDFYGLCYQRPVTIYATLTGPYASHDQKDARPYTQYDEITTWEGVIEVSEYNPNDESMSEEEITKLDSLIACKYTYNVNYGTYDDFRPVRVGWYEINVKVIGDELSMDHSNSSNVTTRITFLSHGDLSLKNSVATMFGSANNRGRDSLYLKASETYDWLLICYDRFDNRFDDKMWPHTLSIVDTSDYIHKIGKLSFGIYQISTIFYTAGEYNTWDMQLNDKDTQISTYKDLTHVNAPDSIVVSPNVCSNIYPILSTDGMGDQYDPETYIQQVRVGKQVYFTIQCKDKFDNTVVSGGEADRFSVFIHGIDLPNVGEDFVINQIADNFDGTYTDSFIVAWPGEYIVSILLDGSEYTIPFEFTGIDSICTDAANPILCPDQKTCKSNYQECNPETLPEDCPAETPIRCKQFGVNTCVATGIDCDCDWYYKKCSDNKCVPEDKITQLCPYLTIDYETIQCSEEFPVFCPLFGGCRVSTDACPTQPICPPGLDLCPDLSCQSSCDYTQFSACSGGEYKCPDGSCQEKPERCATQITCDSELYLCATTQTCVTSPLECSLPADCPLDSHIKCPRDGSCVNNIDSCPSGVSCPEGFALCEDNTCQLGCSTQTFTPFDFDNSLVDEIILGRMLSQKQKRRRLQGLFGVKVDADFITPPLYVICPSGDTANTIYNCPSLPSCGLKNVRCPDGSCSVSLDKCVQELCPEGTFTCWDGKCAQSETECSTRSICPENLAVKCADGTCVDNASKCGVIECQPDKPYRCGSGECASSKSACSTGTICPASMPIKCADGSCKRAPYHCNEISKGYVCPSDSVMCPDRSCAKSLSLCPAIKTCGANSFMCADGTCVDNAVKCNNIMALSNIEAPKNLPIKCPNGEFRKELTDCPTQRICLDGKVLCSDGNCRLSIDLCFTDDQCEFGLKQCPDGTCTSRSCTTEVTCTKDAPYKCHDSTCRKDPRDCPLPAECTEEAPILCSSGKCVKFRDECVPDLPSCPSSTPVLCPNLICATDVSECVSISQCPNGKIRCPMGECMSDISLCRDAVCDSDFPFRCSNGKCVSKTEYCPDPTTGCPFDKPFRCASGICVVANSTCTDISGQCGSNKPCPDGSCYPQDIECPNQQGCPGDEIMCANGICASECPIASCQDGFVKCLSGICVNSFSSCPEIFTSEDYSICASNNDGRSVPCADGTCVASADECLPLSLCPKGYVRCDNGQCRRFDDLCPDIKSSEVCPPHRPVMCTNGMCASSREMCILGNGCPASKSYKCPESGYCTTDSEKCDTLASINECPMKMPYRCPDGSCVTDLSNCVDMVCPSTRPYKCLDGSCSASLEECFKIGRGCKNGTVLCPDLLTCKESFDECKTTSGCPISTPYKCSSNAKCVSDLNECSPSVVCPPYKPYLCSSGECAGDAQLCTSTATTLTALVNCPSSSPILCQTGQCVNSVSMCLAIQSKCPDLTPFRCVTGNCVAERQQCTYVYPGAESAVRQLGSTNATIDQGCSPTQPRRCTDGSCQKTIEQCPIFVGCTDPKEPILCKSGKCSATFAECEGKVGQTCKENQTLCSDGICRATCDYQYNGCENGKLFCSNGMCVNSLAECAGASSCDSLETPFRCADNTCVKEITMCPATFRYHISEKFEITMTPTSTSTANFMMKNGASYATIKVPSGALLTPTDALLPSIETETEMKVKIAPVAWSSLGSLANPIHPKMKDITARLFPLTEGNLDGKNHYSVRSPIINLTTTGRSYKDTNYRYPLQYTVTVDTLNSDEFDPANHLCLSEIKNESWNCVSRNARFDAFNSKITFDIPRDGVYAVIANPRPPLHEEAPPTCQGFICKYIGRILIISSLCLLASAICAYVFSRMYRYVKKYRENKQKMDNFEHQIQELMDMTLDGVGMSLRDKIEGITFTKNVLFKGRPDEDNEIRRLEKLLGDLEVEKKQMDVERKDLVMKNKFFAKEVEILRNELQSQNIQIEGSDVHIDSVEHEFNNNSQL